MGDWQTQSGCGSAVCSFIRTLRSVKPVAGDLLSLGALKTQMDVIPNDVVLLR